MSYYQQTHLRNLEAEAELERHKAEAELYQSRLLSHHSPVRPVDSTEAYIARAQAASELSAQRVRAENTMNRSRLESALRLRQQNQRSNQEIAAMNTRHAMMMESAVSREQEANGRLQQRALEAEQCWRAEEERAAARRREQMEWEYSAEIRRTGLW